MPTSILFKRYAQKIYHLFCSDVVEQKEILLGIDQPLFLVVPVGKNNMLIDEALTLSESVLLVELKWAKIKPS